MFAENGAIDPPVSIDRDGERRPPAACWPGFSTVIQHEAGSGQRRPATQFSFYDVMRRGCDHDVIHFFLAGYVTLKWSESGEGGIRTLGASFGRTRHFQCRPIGHSGTS